MSRAYQLQRGKLSDPSKKFSEVQKTFVSLFSKISLGGPGGLAFQAADSVESAQNTVGRNRKDAVCELEVVEETDAEASGIPGYLVALERRVMGAEEGEE